MSGGDREIVYVTIAVFQGEVQLTVCYCKAHKLSGYYLFSGWKKLKEK